MPNCNIIGCGIKRSRNHPNVTLHQLPANKGKKKIWLETIGIENLKMSTKTIHICSLHFQESCFNRTLNKVTLRDDALPSRTLLPAIQSNMSENDQNQTNTQSISGCGAPIMVDPFCVATIQNQSGEVTKRSSIDLVTSISTASDLAASTSSESDLADSTSAVPDLAASASATPDLSADSIETIKMLKDKCQNQSMTIKRLNEEVRRQKKKIAHLSNIIKILLK
ncbi:unnamed protein product [Parnassius apollo]|uniref:(apollo) hypothetical protein n=1 Tax=Parnassius apollo TaxID=110799 RepID=A0A8S3W4R0_PARAO|nr:unnamed protein product [Parnassius apollo]